MLLFESCTLIHLRIQFALLVLLSSLSLRTGKYSLPVGWLILFGKYVLQTMQRAGELGRRTTYPKDYKKMSGSNSQEMEEKLKSLRDELNQLEAGLGDLAVTKLTDPNWQPQISRGNAEQFKNAVNKAVPGKGD